jgi:hypothetical protein
MWIEPTEAELDEAVGLAARELYRRDQPSGGIFLRSDDLDRMWAKLPAGTRRSYRDTAGAVMPFFIDAARRAQAGPATGRDFS